MSKDSNKPKKQPWRMPPDFRLVDFHKPFLSQSPVILFVVFVAVTVMMGSTVAFYEGTH